MANLYSQHPTVTHTLHEFNKRLKSLEEDDDAFVRAGLTGEYTNSEGQPRQMFIDPTHDQVTEDHDLLISRDYDSAIGISADVMATCPISLHCIPHPTHSLKKSVHLQYPIKHNGDDNYVELHCIPNFEWGQFGLRSTLYLLFPGLWSPLRSKSPKPYQMSQEEGRFLYERGIRPAILNILGEGVASEWPATWDSERERASKGKGGCSFGSRIFPAEDVYRLADGIRFALEMDPTIQTDPNTEWAKNFVVLHTVQGVKHGSLHLVTDDAAKDTLDAFIDKMMLSRSIWNKGMWYIDVAVQISSTAGECLQWMTGGHSKLVQQALQISDHKARQITQIGSSKYVRDLSSHLTEVSGFRITPGVQTQGEFKAVYLQAYTTDKSAVYLNSRGYHAKNLSIQEAMGSVQPAKPVVSMHTIYEGSSRHSSSNARLEVRVPLEFGTRVLLAFNPLVIRECLCSFTVKDWWLFRVLRLMAASKALTLQQAGSTEARMQGEALVLTAACVWLINGLHARPDDGTASRRLMDAALPRSEADEVDKNALAYSSAARPHWDRGEQDAEEEEEEEEGEVGSRGAAYNPFGVTFFRRIVMAEVPRIRCGGDTLPDPTVRFLFGMDIPELKNKYARSGIIDKSVIAAIRPTTNRRKIPARPLSPQPVSFDLRARGRSLPPPAGLDDYGSDLEDRPEGPTPTLNGFLTDIYHLFVVAVGTKSPNPRGSTNPSYLKTTVEERNSGNDNIFKSARLPDTFTAVAYKTADRETWDRAFGWMFPDLNFKTSTKSQNYPVCSYYQKWLEFIDNKQNNPAVVQMARNAISERVAQWSWIPDAQQDKMWGTSVRTGFERWPSPGRGEKIKAAPRILLREGIRPIFEDTGLAEDLDMQVDPPIQEENPQEIDYFMQGNLNDVNAYLDEPGAFAADGEQGLTEEDMLYLERYWPEMENGGEETFSEY